MADKKHDFHFVLTKDLKNKITCLSEKLNLSISDTAIYILGKILGILKKYNYKSEESDIISKYQNIFWDQDMHIYLEKNFYRKIVHLSKTMFAFSIAIVVRWLFNFYFDNENNIEEIMKKINKEIENLEKIIKTWKKQVKSKQLFRTPLCKHAFNDKFTLIGIGFL